VSQIVLMLWLLLVMPDHLTGASWRGISIPRRVEFFDAEVVRQVFVAVLQGSAISGPHVTCKLFD